MKLKTARILDKTILLLATILLAASQYNVPSEAFWRHDLDHHSYLPVVFLAIVGLFGAFSPIESLSRKSRIEHQVTLRRIILTTLGQLFEISKSITPPLDASDFGLHIWRKRRTLRSPIYGELERVATYRLGSVPATRRIRPRKGVGVVGLCWQRDQEVSVDVLELATQLSDKDKFQAHRDANGSDAVMGFTWEEFQRYKHRGAVFASPIRSGRSKFVGCVSFDAERGFQELNSNRLWHQLNSLCALMSREGFDFV